MIHIMAESRGSSRRRLFTTPVSQSTECGVCHQTHTNVSAPSAWKDENCRELATSLGISAHSLVCRPCCNDLARLRKDPSHCPRWEKSKISGCAILQCENLFFSKCHIPISNIAQCLEAAGENNIPKEIDTAPPLCKHHYHVVYNTYKPTQMYCQNQEMWHTPVQIK